MTLGPGSSLRYGRDDKCNAGASGGLAERESEAPN